MYLFFIYIWSPSTVCTRALFRGSLRGLIQHLLDAVGFDSELLFQIFGDLLDQFLIEVRVAQNKLPVQHHVVNGFTIHFDDSIGCDFGALKKRANLELRCLYHCCIPPIFFNYHYGILLLYYILQYLSINMWFFYKYFLLFVFTFVLS